MNEQSIKVKDFDLTHTFECGQCFRWEKQKDGSYTGIVKGRVVNVSLEKEPGDVPGVLTIKPCEEEELDKVWAPYFDLGRDYGEIKKILSGGSDVMVKATEYGYGIRLLRQDLWETIVSFIISQNNNIPRIKGCIARLSENFGKKVETDLPEELLENVGRYTVPEPEVLAGLTVEDLAPVRLGYRAKYLIETAKSVVQDGLPGSLDELSALCGVGPKVANCIALFGMQAYSCFPIDVWVMKVMHELYGLDEGDKKAMAAFAEDRFGELGGFAQQYLFYYMRDRA